MERTDDMPEIVFWGLWGLNSRGAASAFMWGCALIAVASTIAAIQGGEPFFGMAFSLAALWYWYSIRWMDKNGGWTQDSQVESPH